MARRNRDDDLLLEEDELTAAFLGDEGGDQPEAQNQPTANPADDQWDEDEAVPGQPALRIP